MSTCMCEAALVSSFWGPIPENTTHLLSSSDPARPVWAQSAPSHLGEASCSFSLWALPREREGQKAKGTASTPSESLGETKGKQLSDIFLLRFLCLLPVFHFNDKNELYGARERGESSVTISQFFSTAATPPR